MLKAISNREEDRSLSQNNVGRFKEKQQNKMWLD